MQKSILITIVVSGIFLVGQSQPLEMQWQQCYGSSGTDRPRDMLLYNHHYYVVGHTDTPDGDVSSTHGADDFWLIKTDTLGNLIWEKTFGGSKYDAAYGISRSDKDLIITGTSSSKDGDVEFNPYEASNFWVMKVDTSGRLLWEKMYGGNYRDEVIRSIGTRDGGALVVGNTASDDGDVSEYYYLWDGWVVKLDSTGAIEWDYTIGTDLSDDFAQTAIQTSDSGFLVGAASTTKGEGSITCEGYEYSAEALLFKFDNQGNVEWQRCYGGSNSEGVITVIETNDGYLFSSPGGSDDGDCEGCGYHYPGYPEKPSDIWLVKTDFEGNILWHKCYGGFDPKYGHELAKKIFETPHGYVVFGNTDTSTEHGPSGDVTSNPSFYGNPALWILKINNTGELLWERCFGGQGEERLYDAVVQKNWYTYAVLASTTFSPSHDVSCDSSDIYGNYWFFELKDKSVGTPEIDNSESKLKAYPNPAGKQATFSYTLPKGIRKGILELRYPSGTLMKRFTLRKPNGDKSVSTAHWSPGIYFYTLRTNDGIKSGKLVIVK